MSDTNQKDLAGQVAIVTGASRGIGRAIALNLASRGARVACIATSAANAEESAALCSAAAGEGAEARAYGVDVANTDAVSELVDGIKKELGGLDLLVNSAGITRDNLMLRMTEDDFDRVVQVNLKGTWNFCKAATRPLMKSRGGRIVNIASVVGLTGNAGQANYAASKAGVVGLTRSIAKELAGRGVCVNAVAPGFIETDLTRPMAVAQGVSPAQMGMKSPQKGTLAPLFLLFGEPQGSGHYYGSDAVRSPLDRYRSPGDAPFMG